jgi:hypothetical protein
MMQRVECHAEHGVESCVDCVDTHACVVAGWDLQGPFSLSPASRHSCKQSALGMLQAGNRTGYGRFGMAAITVYDVCCNYTVVFMH